MRFRSYLFLVQIFLWACSPFIVSPWAGPGVPVGKTGAGRFAPKYLQSAAPAARANPRTFGRERYSGSPLSGGPIANFIWLPTGSRRSGLIAQQIGRASCRERV